MPTNILKGTMFALGACFIWGLIFIVPLFMDHFTPIEIALGRYFTYGILSFCIFLRIYLQGTCRYPFSIWLKVIGFSLVYSIGYYTFVILAVRYATPAICALILGVSPITIAFYGNWKQKECSYQSLVLPSILILIGLIVINAPYIMESTSPSTYLIGLFCAVWALIGWSWFVVANSAFLKNNPDVKSGDWSTLLGVGTLFWVFTMGLVVTLFFEDQLDFNKYVTPGPELVNFLIGCGVLGLICSWVGAYLWNKASFYLPVSLAGQLTIFETLFGLCFFYMLEQKLPPKMELLGVALLLTAIGYGIRASSQAVQEKALN